MLHAWSHFGEGKEAWDSSFVWGVKRTMFTFSILQTSIGMQSSAWRVDQLIDNKAIDDSYHTSQREMVCKAGKH